MKVNISGKGVIPIINKVAPVYNIEVADEILKKIIKNPNFRVYASEGFGQITAATFNAPAAPVEAPKKAEPVKKAEEVPGVVKEIVVEEKAPVVEEVAIEEPVVEEAPVEIEQVEEPVEMTEEVEAEAVEEELEEVTDEIVEETAEETTEEAAPVQTSKKKKKNRK